MPDPVGRRGLAEGGDMPERVGTVSRESASHEAKKRREGQGPGCDANVSGTSVGYFERNEGWSQCGKQGASRDAGRGGPGGDRNMGGGERRGCIRKTSYNTQSRE